MITVDDLSLQYSGAPLFSKVNLQFTPGNCYGIIGANGAGKSTFLKILSGQLEPSTGNVYIDPKARMSVLKQDQTMYDAYTVMDTVIMGNQRLYDCGKEKDAIYAKDEMTDEDGIRASELEEEFAAGLHGALPSIRLSYTRLSAAEKQQKTTFSMPGYFCSSSRTVDTAIFAACSTG